MSSYKAYCGCQDTLSCLFVKTASSVFFTGFFFPLSSLCFFLSSNKKIYLLTFFHAVIFFFYFHIYFWKMNVYIISFLERFFFPFQKVTLSPLQGCSWTQKLSNVTLRQMYFYIQYYVTRRQGSISQSYCRNKVSFFSRMDYVPPTNFTY